MTQRTKINIIGIMALIFVVLFACSCSPYYAYYHKASTTNRDKLISEFKSECFNNDLIEVEESPNKIICFGKSRYWQIDFNGNELTAQAYWIYPPYTFWKGSDSKPTDNWYWLVLAKIKENSTNYKLIIKER